MINIQILTNGYDNKFRIFNSSLIPTVVGAVGLFQALFTYNESQTLKRKDIIFPLIDEFDNSEDLFLAKAILDDFSCSVPPYKTKNEFLLTFWKMSAEDFQYYNKSNLKKFLRNYKVEPITDCRKLVIDLILAPYLINIRNLSYQESYNIIRNWFDNCYNPKRDNYRQFDYRIKYSLNNAMNKGIGPMSLEKIKTDPTYKILYQILQNKGTLD